MENQSDIHDKEHFVAHKNRTVNCVNILLDQFHPEKHLYCNCHLYDDGSVVKHWLSSKLDNTYLCTHGI